MNRADVRFFEVLNGVVESLLNLGGRGVPARILEPLPEAQFQLARRLLGKRDGDDLPDVGTTFGEHANDPPHELCRLAGTGRGLDDECLVDRLLDQLPRVFVWRHVVKTCEGV